MRLSWILCFFLFFNAGHSYCCEYGDDVRLENDPASLITAVLNKQSIEPISMTLGTYLGLGEKSRAILDEHIALVSLDCKPIGVVDGEIIGKVLMPFDEFYRAMARAIKRDQPNIAKMLMIHGRIAPMPVEQYLDMYGMLPYPATGGMAVRDRMKKIFPDIKRLPPSKEILQDELIQGRMEDYTMARLFKFFGGDLSLEKGCGPYHLGKKFFTIIHMKGWLGKEYDVYKKHEEPVRTMFKIMGFEIVLSGNINYQLTGRFPCEK